MIGTTISHAWLRTANLNHPLWALFVLSVGLYFGSSLQAQAPDSETAHFDDSEPATIAFIVKTPEPFLYKGLVWEAFTVIQADHPSLLKLPFSGYARGAVSGSFAAVAAGRIVEASLVRRHRGGLFIFHGAFLTAGWRTGLEVRLEGLVDGSVVYTEQVTTDTAQPTTIREKWQIDELRITTSGGQDGTWCKQPQCSPGPEVVVDDFRFSLTSEERSTVTSAVSRVTPSQLSKTSTTKVMRAVTTAEISHPREKPVPLPPEAPEPAIATTQPENSRGGNRGAEATSEICHRDTYYGVQLGAFRKESNALGLREKIAKSNWPVQLHQSVLGDSPIYRVIGGCGQRRAEARALLESLSEFRIKGYIVEVRSSEIGNPY